MRLVGRAHVSAETVRNETNHHRERRRTSEDVITPRSPLARPLARFAFARRFPRSFKRFPPSFVRPSVRSFPTESHGRNRWDCSKKAGGQPARTMLSAPPHSAAYSVKANPTDRMPSNYLVLNPRERGKEGHTCFSRCTRSNPIPTGQLRSVLNSGIRGR